MLGACSDKTDDEVRAATTLLLAQAENPSLEQTSRAADRLARLGRPAIPTIESALHTANPTGRKALIMALRKIGDPEAVPLLAHRAQHDPAPDVQREALWTLKQWAASDNKALAAAATAALRAIDEAQKTEIPG